MVEFCSLLEFDLGVLRLVGEFATFLFLRAAKEEQLESIFLVVK